MVHLHQVAFLAICATVASAAPQNAPQVHPAPPFAPLTVGDQGPFHLITAQGSVKNSGKYVAFRMTEEDEGGYYVAVLVDRPANFTDAATGWAKTDSYTYNSTEHFLISSIYGPDPTTDYIHEAVSFGKSNGPGAPDFELYGDTSSLAKITFDGTVATLDDGAAFIACSPTLVNTSFSLKYAPAQANLEPDCEIVGVQRA